MLFNNTLEKSERDFLVCSDCVHFEFKSLLNTKFGAKEGFCKLYKKFVTDVWETKCKHITEPVTNINEFICSKCRFCEITKSHHNVFDYYCTKHKRYKAKDEYICPQFKKTGRR